MLDAIASSAAWLTEASFTSGSVAVTNCSSGGVESCMGGTRAYMLPEEKEEVARLTTPFLRAPRAF